MTKIINLCEKREEKKMDDLAKKVVEDILSGEQDEIKEMLHCGNCHNELFAVLRSGILCSACGFHIGYDEF